MRSEPMPTCRFRFPNNLTSTEQLMRQLDPDKWTDHRISDHKARNYSRAILPDKVRSTKNTVLERVDEPGPEYITRVCALTEFVFETVAYGNVSEALYRCDFILDYGLDGDCEDQTTLLLSLLAAASLHELGFMSVRLAEADAGHLMGLVGFSPAGKLDQQAVEVAIKRYFGMAYRAFGWLRWDGTAWLIVDPVHSPVPGCPDDEFEFGRVTRRGIRLPDGAEYSLSRVVDSPTDVEGRGPEGM